MLLYFQKTHENQTLQKSLTHVTLILPLFHPPDQYLHRDPPGEFVALSLPIKILVKYVPLLNFGKLLMLHSPSPSFTKRNFASWSFFL